jgi:hypothetical protein
MRKVKPILSSAEVRGEDKVNLGFVLDSDDEHAPSSQGSQGDYDDDMYLYSKDDHDDRYLPPHQPDMDSYISRDVTALFESTPLEGTPIDAFATKLSKVACRGRISAEKCVQVLESHSRNAYNLRSHLPEIIEDLHRACKAADRRSMKKRLVADVLHGPSSADYCGKEEEQSGLSAFRRILEEEAKQTSEIGFFNRILYSIMTARGDMGGVTSGEP